MDYSELTPQELVKECARSRSADVWEDFVRVFSKVIIGTVRNVARRYGENSPAVHDELAQDIYLKLCADNCRLLREMGAAPNSNCHGFLKVVALNHTKDHFKGQYAKKRGSGIAPENVDDAQPASAEHSTGGQADMEWQVLKRELEAKLVELGFSDKERTIFGLYYFQGFTAIQISKFPWVGLSVKGVESLIHRMTQALRDFFGEHEGL